MSMEADVTSDGSLQMVSGDKTRGLFAKLSSGAAWWEDNLNVTRYLRMTFQRVSYTSTRMGRPSACAAFGRLTVGSGLVTYHHTISAPLLGASKLSTGQS